MFDIPTASKAALAQTAVATVLNYAGYRVIPNGIEERCPPIIHLDAGEYRALDIPEILRRAPDLLVYSPSECTLQLLEVKFTRSWTADGIRMMLSKLQRQQSLYPMTHTVILRSASAAATPEADDLVRPAVDADSGSRESMGMHSVDLLGAHRVSGCGSV